jgi:hypothetical protein
MEDHDGFRGELREAGLPSVLALKPAAGPGPAARARTPPASAARTLARHGPSDARDWQPATRAFRGGAPQTWEAGDAALGWLGPAGTTCLVVATRRPGQPVRKGHLVPGRQLVPPGVQPVRRWLR